MTVAGGGVLAAGGGGALLLLRQRKLGEAVAKQAQAVRQLTDIRTRFGSVGSFLDQMAALGQNTHSHEFRRVNAWLRAEGPLPAFRGMSTVGKVLLVGGALAAITGAALLVSSRSK